MKKARAYSLSTGLLTAALALAGLSQSLLADQLVTRPLTPQEIKDYTHVGTPIKSPGIPTVGVGDPVYLEAQVANGTVITGDVVWSLDEVPGGSNAILEESPLDPALPIYTIIERDSVDSRGRLHGFLMADRMFLQPDAVGQYKVTAVVPTDGGDVPLELYVTAANYVGVGTINGATPNAYQCGKCHGPTFSSDADKVTGWETTLHSQALSEFIVNVGQPTDHFGERCLSCHTTGYNTDPLAVNGGFDDVAVDVGWTVPTTATAEGDPTHWDNVPELLKQKSNVQCEACHGPGSEHRGLTDFNEISTSYSVGDCAQCHDSLSHHVKAEEWGQSLHGNNGDHTSADCARCHTGTGFIQHMDGVADADIELSYSPIMCQACHDPHGSESHHQLRSPTTVTLLNGFEVTKGGNGQVCMNCHQSRYDINDPAHGSDSFYSRIGPHHGPQTEMLVGTGAYEFGQNLPTSGHYAAIEDSCVTCHMHEGEVSDVGVHLFTMKNELGEENVGSCQACHGESVDTFNIPQDDHDGDGVVEGIQDEILGLLAQVGEYFGNPAEGATVKVAAGDSITMSRAAWNYNFVVEDKSLGIHNSSYAVAILKATLRALGSNDSDENGLDDSLELQYFGQLGNDPAADDDNDGLTNAEEFAQGTDPLLADSDDDGFSDMSELHLGTNPMRADDKPDTNQRVYPAIEFLFYAQAGVTYQIQSTEELGSSVWINEGAPFDGYDDFSQTFFSTINKDLEFYRVIVVE